MGEHLDAGEEKRAQQLMAYLEGQAGEVDEETAALADFARSLPWERPVPDWEFRARLRRELLARGAASRVRAFRPAWLWSTAGALIVVLVAALALIALSGPRIRDIFGVVYSSLGGGAAQQPAPCTLPSEVAVTQPPMVVPAPTPVSHPSPTMPAIVLRRVEMEVRVSDVALTVENLSGLAGRLGGHVVQSQSWMTAGRPQALVVLALPSAATEEARRQVRAWALEVERESVAEEEVTAEYVRLMAQERAWEDAGARWGTPVIRSRKLGWVLGLQVERHALQGMLLLVRRRMEAIGQGADHVTLVVHLR